MKSYAGIFLLIGTTLFLSACLKGRFPAEVVVPQSYIDSTFLGYFRQTSGLTAGEGARSFTLADGRVIWLFGQSHLNDYNTSLNMIACNPNVNNAAVTMSPTFQFQTLNAGLNDFIPSNEAGRWFYPLHGYQYADTVFIFARKQGGGVNNRTYVAKYHFPDLQYLRLDSFAYANTIYGYSMFTDSARGFCYIYGLVNTGLFNDNAMVLARFRMNSLHDTWQFYSHDTWVNLPSGATSLVSVPGDNFSVCEVDTKFILLTQAAERSCNKGTSIFSQTASNPYGPFHNDQLLHTISDSLSGATPVTYGVTLHREFLNADGEILVTYAIHGYEPCVANCIGGYTNPDYYRIRTLRVALRKIDPGF